MYKTKHQELTLYIINQLLDEYEDKSNLLNKIELNFKIKLKITNLFPEYFISKEEDYQAKIDAVILELIQDEYITTTYLFDEYYELVLNTSNIEATYEFVQRKNRFQIKEEAYYLLSQLSLKSKQANVLKNKIIKDILNNVKLECYFDLKQPQEMLGLLTCIDQIIESDIEYNTHSLQEVSCFENIDLDKVYLLIKDYLYLENLNKINVVSAPSNIYIKGNLTLIINEQTLDLTNNRDGLALMSTQLHDLALAPLSEAYKVIIVEDKETFFNLQIEEAIIIHFDEYFNSSKGYILKQLNENSNLKFYYLSKSNNYQDYLVMKELLGANLKLIGDCQRAINVYQPQLSYQEKLSTIAQVISLSTRFGTRQQLRLF
ncbi:MAG: hypothetical protein ACRCTA_05220 [Bacilli bacterium]